MDLTKYPALVGAAKGQELADCVFQGGSVLNVFTGEVLRADVAVKDGTVVGVGKGYQGKEAIDCTGLILAPGFLDAHLHLESTMVTPSELVENAVKCGTTTYIVDPHESANVSGANGIDYILNETDGVPANVYVMMPSCVPSVPFEDNGCAFPASEMAAFLKNPRVLGLGEVMDYVSVVGAAKGMLDKLALFQGRVCDGHAPFLPEKDLNAYVLAGIRTDHEAGVYDYAIKESRLGLHVHVREGSAARDLAGIVSGLVSHGIDTTEFSFCTDDKHVEDIRREGHISWCIKKAIELGLKPYKAYQMATINTARCYGLNHLGAIAPGRQADFVLLRDLEQVEIAGVYHKGKSVEGYRGAGRLSKNSPLRSTVKIKPLEKGRLFVSAAGETDVIGLVPGQLATVHKKAVLPQKDGAFIPDGQYSKIAVIERHHATGKVGVGVVEGFGIQNGAIASSVSHDSHNITVVGDNDEDMILAVSELEKAGGGFVIVSGGKTAGILPLPIMGLMSDAGFEKVEKTLAELLQTARRLGVHAELSPFVTLSFLALPVIPSLRITPRGMYDVEKGAFLTSEG